jgi:hypothetical protein
LHKTFITFAVFNSENNRMKFWTTIVCTYILLISVTPCCRNNHIADEGCRLEQQDSGERPHTDCSGICSPFCLCDTCGGFMVIQFFTGFQLKQQEFSKANLSYPGSIYHSPLLKGIWQPPQI